MVCNRDPDSKSKMITETESAKEKEIAAKKR